MKINPTTTTSPNTMVFKGTVDKSIVGIIDRGIANTLRSLTEEAKKNNKRLEPEKIIKLSNLRERTLYLLKSFMKRLHPKTVLKTNGQRVYFENNKINVSIGLTKHRYGENTYEGIFKKDGLDLIDPLSVMPKDNMGKIDEARLSSFSASAIEAFAKDLHHLLDPGQMDKKMFELFVERLSNKAKNQTIFGRFRAMLNGKKADSLAQEFGIKESNWANKLLKINKESVKANEENCYIKAENQETMRKIFKKD